MPHPRSLPRAATLTGAVLLGVLALGAAPPSAGAAEPGEVSIDLMEAGEDSLRVLVSLPDGAVADLDEVAVTLDGEDAEVAASVAGDQVRRTAVLAIDTSTSMAGERIEAAEAAARTFVASVPDDLFVGVVTFDGEARTVLQPTQDRAAATAAVTDLEMDEDTALYDGVQAAVALTGTEGARQVLLLSDGQDSVGGSLPAAVETLRSSGVRVDAVALDDDASPQALTDLAVASGGTLVAADPDSLAGVFAGQAETLANQLVLDVTVPPGVDSATAPIAVSVGTTGGQALAASALAPLGDLGSAAAPQGPDLAAAPSSGSGTTLPSWAMYAGVGVFGVGILGALALAAAPRRRGPMTAEERVTTYTEAVRATSPGRPAESTRRDPDAALTQAKDAATQVLRRNQGLESAISARLEGAGSALKPAEWLLVHVAVFVGAGIVGLLVGGGNLLIGLLFLAAGAVLPWVYLGRRRTKRRKRFDSALPDTLQLMSGALSAGLSLAQACDTIARDGQEPVASEFKRVLVETRLGVGVEDALTDVADRFESKDFRWVVMAIRIQREVGGNLSELLQTVAGTMREREYLRRQVQSLSAEGRMSAVILAVLPPGFMLFQLVAQPAYIMPLFVDPRGWVVLGAGVLLLALGVFWMSRMVKVEV
ncbi:type II secretion system F family protein [Nocardioides sp. ChNu-153]|uniref:type II secretion system F family protein n=1 Tax=unclassified Nocardioides TaxID=2615069 RepID=UPI0024064A85|nr:MULTISPECIES: type II secretion system F family protein [unclassified Nocardioides]MDF9715913.1 type II secretion system F family protein [Nocardioides sp. ChNu-99]MDN7122906.1 type II secretion system F family protein [Nocardioides sp. ChNu-153]